MGYVQAINARTGKRVWAFSVIPQSANDPGASTWENGSWRTQRPRQCVGADDARRGARAALPADLPRPRAITTAAGRPGANLFAESLVCLEAATGKMKWYFQTVHHGLWDWDNPAPPNLVTITVNGQRIDAVAQVTKQGFTYVFDRVTGKPVWPIVERPVPTDSDVPGEKPYATQPFPTKPPAFVEQGVSLEDANNLTPEIHRLAEEQMRKYRIGPMFTPPSLEGTLQRPSQSGGANWGGAAFDPETGYLFVRAANAIGLNRLAKNDGSDPLVAVEYSNVFARGRGIRHLAWRPAAGFASLCRAHRHRSESWRDRLESSARGGKRRAPQPSAAERGVTARSSRLAEQPRRRHGNQEWLGVHRRRRWLSYAFDKKNGKELWRGKVPFENAAVPMTYRTRAGRQFVVVATGTGAENTLVAFALGGSGQSAP